MKNCFKKVISAAVVIVVSAALLSGCGARKDQNQDNVVTPTATTTETTTAEKTESPLVNRTGLPIVNQPVTFDMMVRKNVSDLTTWADKEAVKKAELETGMKFNWIEVQTAAWREKVSVTLASGNLPDAIIGEMDDFPIFLESFISLDDLIKDFAPNVVKLFEEFPEIRVACTQGDGKIYSLPLVQYNGWTAAYALSINKTWLNNLNLEVPQTTEELYQVLKAFKERDPNGNGQSDEIPFGFYFDDEALSMVHFYPMMWNFGLINDGMGSQQQFVMVENGKVFFIGADNRFYEFLKFMNRLNAAGLIDPEGFLQNYQDYVAKGNRDIYGLVAHHTYVDIVVGREVGDDFVTLLPMKDANGHRTVDHWKVDGNLMPTVYKITNACEHPEALVRLYDYANSSIENRLLWSFGPTGVVLIPTDDGKFRRNTEMPEGFRNFAELRQTMSPGMAGFWFLTLQENETLFTFDKREQQLIDRRGIYKPYFRNERIPIGQDTAEATNARVVMFNEINMYMRHFVAESILKGIDDAKWNSHLETLKKLNVDKYVQDFQAFYDRSMAALNKR